MKKNTHLPLHQISYYCNYCNQKFSTVSTSNQDVRTGPCSNCHSFYTGAAASETKVGAVEKFRQRNKKVKAKSKEN